MYDPFKVDVFALGITTLVMCSLGRFVPKDRMSYCANSLDHTLFLRQSRKNFVKKRYSGVLNRLVKLMLEDDEFKR